jgi:hypothetical protein
MTVANKYVIKTAVFWLMISGCLVRGYKRFDGSGTSIFSVGLKAMLNCPEPHKSKQHPNILIHSFSNCGTPTIVYWKTALIKKIRNTKNKHFKLKNKT